MAEALVFNVEVRCLGPATYEARTRGGLFSAIGFSRETSVALLRNQLPGHAQPIVEHIPNPSPVAE